MTNKEDRNWYYLLPDGRTADNMRDARNMMGLGVQGFRALVRNGKVKKVMITTETSEYEHRKS